MFLRQPGPRDHQIYPQCVPHYAVHGWTIIQISIVNPHQLGPRTWWREYQYAPHWVTQYRDIYWIHVWTTSRRALSRYRYAPHWVDHYLDIYWIHVWTTSRRALSRYHYVPHWVHKGLGHQQGPNQGPTRTTTTMILMMTTS